MAHIQPVDLTVLEEMLETFGNPKVFTARMGEMRDLVKEYKAKIELKDKWDQVDVIKAQTEAHLAEATARNKMAKELEQTARRNAEAIEEAAKRKMAAMQQHLDDQAAKLGDMQVECEQEIVKEKRATQEAEKERAEAEAQKMEYRALIQEVEAIKADVAKKQAILDKALKE